MRSIEKLIYYLIMNSKLVNCAEKRCCRKKEIDTKWNAPIRNVISSNTVGRRRPAIPAVNYNEINDVSIVRIILVVI